MITGTSEVAGESIHALLIEILNYSRWRVLTKISSIRRMKPDTI